MHALFDLKLVSQESLEKMKTEKMGLTTFPLGEKTFYGHTGGIDGFNSMLAYMPEEKFAVAYTSNGKVYPVNDILLGVFDIYYNKPFTMPTFETVEVSAEELEKFVGVYSNENFPLKITVSRKDATAVCAGDRATRISARSDGKERV